jgi:hypothetical protein
MHRRVIQCGHSYMNSYASPSDSNRPRPAHSSATTRKRPRDGAGVHNRGAVVGARRRVTGRVRWPGPRGCAVAAAVVVVVVEEVPAGPPRMLAHQRALEVLQGTTDDHHIWPIIGQVVLIVRRRRRRGVWSGAWHRHNKRGRERACALLAAAGRGRAAAPPHRPVLGHPHGSVAGALRRERRHARRQRRRRQLADQRRRPGEGLLRRGLLLTRRARNASGTATQSTREKERTHHRRRRR